MQYRVLTQRYLMTTAAYATPRRWLISFRITEKSRSGSATPRCEVWLHADLEAIDTMIEALHRRGSDRHNMRLLRVRIQRLLRRTSWHISLTKRVSIESQLSSKDRTVFYNQNCAPLINFTQSESIVVVTATPAPGASLSRLAFERHVISGLHVISPKCRPQFQALDSPLSRVLPWFTQRRLHPPHLRLQSRS